MCLKCNSKNKYGEYCYKHRKYFLCNKDDVIIHKYFTNKESDYLKKDIITTLKKYNISITTKSKHELFIILSNMYLNLTEYQKDINKIIYIQNEYRNRKQRKTNILRGEYLRLILSSIIILVSLKLLIDLVTVPSDLFSVIISR